jgi:hypothetical protein
MVWFNLGLFNIKFLDYYNKMHVVVSYSLIIAFSFININVHINIHRICDLELSALL